MKCTHVTVSYDERKLKMKILFQYVYPDTSKLKHTIRFEPKDWINDVISTLRTTNDLKVDQPMVIDYIGNLIPSSLGALQGLLEEGYARWAECHGKYEDDNK